jgi:hypothetical protein
MRKLILISACLAMILGLSGCQNPNAAYTIYYQGGPAGFTSPYDDPALYHGPIS